MMEAIIQNNVDNYNTRPIADFENMSPNQMKFVLYDLFGESCPIKLKEYISDEVLDKIPFFRMCEEFLKIVQREKVLKLTSLGNMQKKIVMEVYDFKFITDDLYESEFSKSFRELELTGVHNARLICYIAGLIKKSNNSLSLTAKGTKILATEKRSELFKLILHKFMKEFIWGYNDAYDDEATGQIGNGFILILLMRYGSEPRTIQFYADRYLKAFPNILKNYSYVTWTTPESAFYTCFDVRVFERFLYWFAFVRFVEKQGKGHSIQDTVITEDFLSEIFHLKI